MVHYIVQILEDWGNTTIVMNTKKVLTSKALKLIYVLQPPPVTAVGLDVHCKSPPAVTISILFYSNSSLSFPKTSASQKSKLGFVTGFKIACLQCSLSLSVLHCLYLHALYMIFLNLPDCIIASRLYGRA